MKNKNLIIVLISTYAVFAYSCSTTRFPAKLQPAETMNKQNILIIPFKAPPILIYNRVHSWRTNPMVNLLGLLYIPIRYTVDEITQGKREKTAEMLNKTIGEWRPENVLAQECSTLICEYSQIKNLKIANTREMPGTEAIREEEPKVFSAKSGFGTTLQQKWGNALNSWLKKNSTIKYRQDYPQFDDDWVLEAGFSGITIVKSKNVELGIVVRLVDISSNKKVEVGFAGEIFIIKPINDISSFELFKEDFRKSTKKLCHKILSDMELISVQKE